MTAGGAGWGGRASGWPYCGREMILQKNELQVARRPEAAGGHLNGMDRGCFSLALELKCSVWGEPRDGSRYQRCRELRRVLLLPLQQPRSYTANP